MLKYVFKKSKNMSLKNIFNFFFSVKTILKLFLCSFKAKVIRG
jgi:hypothetical protein